MIKKFLLILTAALFSTGCFSIGFAQPTNIPKTNGLSTEHPSRKFVREGHKKATTTQTLDRLVATVHEDVITQSELDKEISLFQKNVKAAGFPIPPVKLVRQTILHQMIDKKLLLTAADRMKIKITPEEKQKAIEFIAKANKLTPKTLYKQIEAEGLTRQVFNQQLNDQLIIQKLQGQVLVPHIKINNKELESFTQTYKKMVSFYHMVDIVILFPKELSDTTIKQTEAKAKKAMAILHSSPKFEESVIKDIPAKFQDLKWRRPAEMPQPFADTMLSMNVGDIRGPIKAPNGYHIIKLLGTKKQKVSAMEARQQLFQKKLQDSTQAFLKKLHKEIYVKVY
jgi:peptidyl-prolyl cis-trans isomerase SurA